MKKIIILLLLFSNVCQAQMFRHTNAVTVNNGAVSYTYATWNPADKDAGVTLSGGDLTVTATTGGVRANIGKSSGKWYWEITFTTVGFHQQGAANLSWSTVAYMGSAGSASASMWQDDGNTEFNGVSLGNNTPSTSSDKLGLALDMDAGTLKFYHNGALQTYVITGITGTFYPAFAGGGSSAVITANFGASAFTYSPPSGYNSGVYN